MATRCNSGNTAASAREADRRLVTSTTETVRSRRLRTSFTGPQLEHLEQTFLITHYPNVKMRQTLSKKTGIEETKIQIWFQNRRAKWRRYMRLGNFGGLQDLRDVDIIPAPKMASEYRTNPNVSPMVPGCVTAFNAIKVPPILMTSTTNGSLYPTTQSPRGDPLMPSSKEQCLLFNNERFTFLQREGLDITRELNHSSSIATLRRRAREHEATMGKS